MGGDLFWQHGDQLSTGKTSDDTNTIYYGTSDWTGLVTNHINAINAKYGGGGTPTNPTSPATTSTPPKTTVTPPKTSTTPPTQPTPPATGGTVPMWGQCGGIGYTGATKCVSGSTCKYSNDWYSQCL